MQTFEPRGHDVFGEARRLEMEARMLRAEAVVEAFAVVGQALVRAFAPMTAVVRRASETLARRRQADRIYAELSRMSDHDLSDIGIARSDIQAVAEGKYLRPEHTAGEVVVLRARTPKPAVEATEELDRAA